MGRPLPQPTLSGVLPDWCHNIADKIVLTTLKRLVGLAPGGKFEARNAGRIAGVLLRQAVFLLKDVPGQLKREGLLDLSPEKEEKVQAMIDRDAILSFASAKMGKPISSEEELWQVGSVELGKMVCHSVGAWLKIGRYLLTRPVAEQYEFLCGLPEGFSLFLNVDGEYAGKTQRTELYSLLLIYWPEIAEMQKADPPKSCKLLLIWLEEQDGTRLVEDERQFLELCGDIGLVMAAPGHPHKTLSE
jgi:hypothetical protein